MQFGIKTEYGINRVKYGFLDKRLMSQFLNAMFWELEPVNMKIGN